MTTREEAEQAVRTLISWAGDDPNRAELIDTPRRVIDSYKEYFCGYHQKIDHIIDKTFPTHGHQEMIILREIAVESHCEHHMVPIIGKAAIAYIPHHKIIGLSKIARIVDMFAKRLQIQERLVMEIANCLEQIIAPKGVGVVIESSHQCLSLRGAYKPGSLMRTSHMIGCFKEADIRSEFLNSL